MTAYQTPLALVILFVTHLPGWRMSEHLSLARPSLSVASNLPTYKGCFIRCWWHFTEAGTLEVPIIKVNHHPFIARVWIWNAAQRPLREKFGSQFMVLLEGREPLRGRAYWKEVRLLSSYLDSCPFCPFLAAMRWTALFLHALSTMPCLTTGPTTTSQLKLLKP